MGYKKRGALICTDVEKAQLGKISRSKTEERRRVQRARVMLSYMEHGRVTVIAKEVGLSRQSIYEILDKALAFGVIAALDDLAGRGAPAEIRDDAKAWVRSLACQSPRDLGYPHEVWTISLLAAHVRSHCMENSHPALQKAGKSVIHGILNKAGIKPHKIRYYLEKRDEHFEEKMAQVLAVYKEIEIINTKEAADAQLAGERKTATISYDEKPGIQALKNIAAQLPPVAGKYPAVGRDYEYKRLGTLSLLAGIDLHSGNVIPLVEERHRSAEFIKFLKKITENYPQDWKIKIILDNHSSHRSKETMNYLTTIPGKFEFVFTPTHGSWLRSFLRQIRVSSIQELADRIYQGIENINQEPVIFRWKYKMEETKIQTTEMST